MKKIKVLEVNNIDLPGNRFNGYDMIQEVADDKFEIKQAVIFKESDNEKVIKMLNKGQLIIHDIYETLEREQSIHNVFSITSPALFNLQEYKDADIIHFHLVHNTKLSLYSLIKAANEKKVIVSIHDPWFLTGRCVHFYDCNKWKTGCKKCSNLSTAFEFKEDNCSTLWNLKKYVFDNIDVDVVCSSDWMLDNTKVAPIFKNQKYFHKIPLGIDYERFSSVSYNEARKKLNIEKDEIVLFFRAQNEFKGTPYIVEAMKMLDTNKKITLMTCDNKGLINDLNDKYKVIELGRLQDDEMIIAMNACDIFLMPSIGESFGLMAIEAMACAKPVVVFNNSALPSVTHAPKCGYLVKDRDSKDLMTAIKTLVEDSKEREKRGKLGKKIVQNEYGNKEYNEGIRNLYLSVMERKHKIYSPKMPKENIENINNLKAYLNILTIRIFGNNKRIRKELYYDVDETLVDKTKPIKYDDIKIHHILEEYSAKVEEISRIRRNSVKKTSIFHRAMFFLIHDRSLLKEKIMRRLKKKD